jgi:endonuclease YncB( thermonuclease family)
LKQILTALGAAWILACSLPVFALEISYFYDGDTVKIKDGTKVYKLRITDIDAPERTQTYGLKSRRALMKLCKNTSVQVQLLDVDKYGRKLGKLECNNQDASFYMVKNGHAWFYEQYSSDSALELAELEASNHKRGLWQNQHPTPPWVWRKNHPH